MKRVRIYTCSSIKSLKAAKTQNEAVGYILAYDTTTGPAELINTVILYPVLEKMTANQSELLAVIMAVSRINTECEIDLYTDSGYIGAAFENGWLDTWKKNGWKTATGDDISNKEDWKQLEMWTSGCVVRCHVKEKHEYSLWLPQEVTKIRQYVGRKSNGKKQAGKGERVFGKR